MMDIEIVQQRTICPHCDCEIVQESHAVTVAGNGPYHGWCGDVVEWATMTPEQVREKVRRENSIVTQD